MIDFRSNFDIIITIQNDYTKVVVNIEQTAKITTVYL